MKEPCATNNVGFLLSDTARMLKKRFDQRARDIGLTRAQWQVLALLARNEGSSQATIADMLDIEPITLSRHVDKMAEAGWVRREADPGDRRIRRLYLTEPAEAVIEEVRRIGRGLMGEVLDGLPEEHRRHFVETLEHIRARLSDRPAPAEGEDASPIGKRD